MVFVEDFEKFLSRMTLSIGYVLSFFTRYVHAIHVVLIAVYVFTFRYLPLIDYRQWVYQGFVFKEYVFFGNDFLGFFFLHHFITPHAIDTVIIGALSLFISPFFAGKIMLFVTALTLYFGVYFFTRIYLKEQRFLAALIAFAFVFNFNFFLGNVAFLLGLGLSCLGVYLVIEKNLLFRMAFAVPFFLLVYFAHFIGFSILVFFVFFFFLFRRDAENIKRLFVALIIPVFFFLHYTLVSHTPGERLFFDLWGMIRDRVLIFVTQFTRFPGFAFSKLSPPLFLAVANYIGVGTFIILFIVALRHVRDQALPSVIRLVVGVFLALVILLPTSNVHGSFRTGERLMLFLMLNVILLVLLKYPRLIKGVTIALVALNVLTYLHIVSNNFLYNRAVISGAYREMTPPSRTYGIPHFGDFDPFQFERAILEKKGIHTFEEQLFGHYDAH